MPKNPHADFSPVLDGYSGIGAFRFWCQTALPLTYDDSLSYYELLCKVVNYLNHAIEDLSNVEENTGKLAEAYTKLQNYVNEYFDTLDIEAELRNVLDAMAQDGTLDALLDPLVTNHLPNVVDDKIDDVVADQIDNAVAGQINNTVAQQLPGIAAADIPAEVTNWLNANVNPAGSAVMVDSTLTISGAAADAKVTGDELSELKTQISEVVDTTEVWNEIELTVDNHGYYRTDGTYVYEGNRRNAIVTGVIPGDLYRISTSISSPLIAAIMYYNDTTLLSYEKAGSGTQETLTNYEFTIPANCNKIIVQNSVAHTPVFALDKYIETDNIFRAYTKEESDERYFNITDGETLSEKVLDIEKDVSKKYGIKWEISDPDDLGTRCFDAVGLSATIGIGATNGSSDFDSIYPWSEMKRCNIKTNSAGAKIVTFEGETGFALDGSNGDVFVRIPKFYYERYQENGFEYRVISAVGTNVHPAFIENGEELDEIFIGAFEGVIESNKLKSKGGIIPTSNEVGQTFLTAAQANGDEYSLYDNRCVDAVWNLMAIEYGLRNTNAIIGYGYADFLQAASGQYGVDCDISATGTNIFSAAKTVPEARLNNMPVGSNVVICKGSQDNCIAFRKLVSRTSDANHWYLTFDGDPIDLDTTCFIGSAGCTTNFCETVPSGGLSWHTGRANWIANSDTKNPVRYRWIENIVGSLWHILPDITFNNLQMYQCKNMKDYVMHKYTDTYKAIGNTFTENDDNGEKADVTGYNYWITELDNNIFTKGIDFGRVYNKQLTSKKAFGAYYYLWSGVKAIINGGGFDHLYRCNMLTQRAWLGETQKWYLYGARLIYKDVT